MEFRENKVREELIKHIMKFNYATKNGDDSMITLWMKEPRHSKVDDYWMDGGDSFEFEDDVELSDFVDVYWANSCILLNENIIEIEKLESKLDKLMNELSIIQDKLHCVRKIAEEVDLSEYLEKLENVEYSLEAHIEDINIEIQELKK